MPVLGFGVLQAEPEQTLAVVSTALQTGYRHIDTAASYGNERQVGEAIRRSGLDRSELFVETKVWVTDYGRMRENLDVVDFTVTDDQNARIATLDAGASSAFDHRAPASVAFLGNVRFNT